jgi:hypothetical protein
MLPFSSLSVEFGKERQSVHQSRSQPQRTHMPKYHRNSQPRGMVSTPETATDEYVVHRHHNSQLFCLVGGENDNCWARLRYRLHTFVITTNCTESQLDAILFFQKNLHKKLHVSKDSVKFFFRTADISTTEIIIRHLCPMLFGLGVPGEALQLFYLLTLVHVVASFINDFIGVKRPPSPPVRRRGASYHLAEYAFPSRNAAVATILCIVSCRAAVEVFHWQPATLLYGVGIARLLQVVAADVYLGLHWIDDGVWGIVTGCFVFCAAMWSSSISDHLSSLRGLVGVWSSG